MSRVHVHLTASRPARHFTHNTRLGPPSKAHTHGAHAPATSSHDSPPDNTAYTTRKRIARQADTLLRAARPGASKKVLTSHGTAPRIAATKDVLESLFPKRETPIRLPVPKGEQQSIPAAEIVNEIIAKSKTDYLNGPLRLGYRPLRYGQPG